MVAPRAPILAALASLACAGAQARHHALPPPAGDGRVGAASTRADPVLASGSGPAAAPRPDVARALETASALVGSRRVVVDGFDYGPGCAALVRAALDRAGHPLPAPVHDAGSLHAFAEARGALRASLHLSPGDLLFLADRPGGPPVHVGLVARVDPDGTALALYRVARGVMRIRVNPGQPSRTTDPATGRRLNDTLLVGRASLPVGSLVVGVAAIGDLDRGA